MPASGRHLLTSLHTVWNAGRDFVFPPSCTSCGGELPFASASLCESCRTTLAPTINAWCMRCSAPTGPYLDTSDGCVHCGEDRFAFERAIALGVYDGALRAACLRCKHEKSGPLAAGLAELLWERRQADLQAAGVTVVVPVPLHWWHRLLRPPAPAATVAWSLGRRLKVPVATQILVKRRRTPAQAALPAIERRRNLRDAFAAAPWAALSGESVLLVDDVMTTGTTAHRCARVLKDAGAARVIVAVAARGIGR